MTLYLVRHASAGDRTRYDGDDLERPLDDRGRRQSEALLDQFEDREIRSVRSSIATRCQQTVAPIAAAHGVEVMATRELTEGARPNDLLELMRAEAADEGGVVMCGHGDLIPEVLNRLLREGMSVVGPRGCEKASVWTLETRGRDIVSARYTTISV